jgi:RNase adapter protein RapZ
MFVGSKPTCPANPYWEQMLRPSLPPARPIGITLTSFGYYYGDFKGANILIDVRDLISPDSISKSETGLDNRIKNLVREYEPLISTVESLINLLYKSAPRRTNVIAIGCSSGRHRSVALVEILNERLTIPHEIVHRDLQRKLL